MHPLKIATVIAALFVTEYAYAGYTVIDDDLFPTSQVEQPRYQPRSEYARIPPAPRVARQAAEEHFSIPFAKYHSPLTAAGRAKLEEILPSLEGAQIRIVGRPDAIYYAEGKLAPLARNRANVLRAYLIEQGIPAANIKTEVDTSPNPQPNGTSYPSEIYATRAERFAPPATDMGSAPRQSAYQPQVRQGLAQTVPQAAAANDDRMIQYINQAVQNGQLRPDVALKLIRNILDGNPPNTASPIPVSFRPSLQPTATAALPIQPAPQPTVWTLDKRLTLRDNIDAWSKIAGWNPSQWDASNYFQVNVTTTIDGNFPDVLRQVADSTGLNICAKVREKYVRVTDSNVSCKDR